MELIAISEDTLVNPDKVSIVEIVRKKDTAVVRITIEGKSLNVDKPQEFLKAMLKSGVNLNQQFFSV